MNFTTWELECAPCFFEACADGKRRHVVLLHKEVRTGDILEYTETDEMNRPTGRHFSGYVTSHDHYPSSRGFVSVVSMEWVTFIYHSTIPRQNALAPKGVVQ